MGDSHEAPPGFAGLSSASLPLALGARRDRHRFALRAIGRASARAVTFTKDVAPILQQKCQVCHQPNSIAPMPLMTLRGREEIRERDQDARSPRA